MIMRDLEESAFKDYCTNICRVKSIEKHFEEKDFRVYYNDGSVIPFNSRMRKWIEFSNFHCCKLEYEGMLFNSSEQMFFYLLTVQQPHLQKLVMQQSDARSVKLLHIPDEQQGLNRNTVMRLCLQTKFEQCSKFRNALLSTKDMTLIEYAPWGDYYWGCNLKDNYYFGCNAMGRLLMELRNKYKG